jgi:hypothetical protein
VVCASVLRRVLTVADHCSLRFSQGRAPSLGVGELSRQSNSRLGHAAALKIQASTKRLNPRPLGISFSSTTNPTPLQNPNTIYYNSFHLLIHSIATVSRDTSGHHLDPPHRDHRHFLQPPRPPARYRHPKCPRQRRKPTASRPPQAPPPRNPSPTPSNPNQPNRKHPNQVKANRPPAAIPNNNHRPPPNTTSTRAATAKPPTPPPRPRGPATPAQSSSSSTPRASPPLSSASRSSCSISPTATPRPSSPTRSTSPQTPTPRTPGRAPARHLARRPSTWARRRSAQMRFRWRLGVGWVSSSGAVVGEGLGVGLVVVVGRVRIG